MFYILGLGNPESKYDGTRHNVGRDFVRVLAGESGWDTSKHANAQYVWGTVAETDVEWLLPETYMNKSGDTARYVAEKHGATPQQFVVLYDDVDLAIGELKVSVGKGDGGHNGIKSIIGALKSKDFVRIRVGVAPKSFWTGKARRPEAAALSRHVLGKFSSGEQKKLADVRDKVEQVLETVVKDGVEIAMNQFN